jgi:hypothetical protein
MANLFGLFSDRERQKDQIGSLDVGQPPDQFASGRMKKQAPFEAWSRLPLEEESGFSCSRNRVASHRVV